MSPGHEKYKKTKKAGNFGKTQSLFFDSISSIKIGIKKMLKFQEYYSKFSIKLNVFSPNQPPFESVK